MDVPQDLIIRLFDQFLDSTFESIPGLKFQKKCHLWLIITLKMQALTGHPNERHLADYVNERFDTQLIESPMSLPLAI